MYCNSIKKKEITMKTADKINDLSNTIEHKYNTLKEYNDIIGIDSLNELKKLVDNFRKDAKSKEDENRLLRIGIIGQIKRGKSSFLNALLFEGQDILPKAATPMTAALTRIKYSEEIRAEIEFYSSNDWESVKNSAIEAQRMIENKDFSGEIPKENEACLEIYNNAIKTGIISNVGSEPMVLEGVDCIEDLTNKLKDYVGTEGKYTPIVKSTKLSLNIESLKDIEIVDTPGTNDPVISRSKITQDFIGECDVVFFLSLCSQFLDSNDMSLLAQNIPDKGINDIFLVGSLFDHAMFDESDNYEGVKELIQNLRIKYKKRAVGEINKKIEKANKADQVILNTLQRASDSFFCVSSMSYNIAKHINSLSKDEQFFLNKLNNLYKDFSFSEQSLFVIGNIKTADDKLNEVRKKKDQIIAQALESVITGTKSGFNNLTSKIKKSVQEDYGTFMQNDVASLEKLQKEFEKTMTQGKSRIKNLFTEYSIKVERDFADVRHDIKLAASKAKRVNTETGSETESYTVDKGHGFLFWNDITGNRYETKDKTITYRYANVHDAISQLENFVLDSEGQLYKAIKGIIDIEKFRKSLLTSISDLFDKSDDNFDPMEIIQTLNNAVNRVTVPDVNIECSKHISNIRGKFKSPTVKNSEIESLRAEQGRVLSLIMEDINKEVKTQTDTIVNKLHEVEETFIPELLKSFTDKIEKMKKDKENSDNVAKSYETILNLI